MPPPPSILHLSLLTTILTTTLLPFTTTAQTTKIITITAPAATVQAPTSTITPTPTPSADLLDDEKFTSAILNSTNYYRGQHSASLLTWNKTLEDFAEGWLDDVAKLPSSSSSRGERREVAAAHGLELDIYDDKEEPGLATRFSSSRQDDSASNLPTCDFKHSGGPYGENLAIGCSSAASCVEAWGNERLLHFPYGDPNGFTEQTGHFSQLVWKSTTTVGCARRECRGGKVGSGPAQGAGYSDGWYLVCEYWPRGNVLGAFDKEVGGYIGSEPLGNGGSRGGGRIIVGGGKEEVVWWKLWVGVLGVGMVVFG